MLPFSLKKPGPVFKTYKINDSLNYDEPFAAKHKTLLLLSLKNQSSIIVPFFFFPKTLTTKLSCKAEPFTSSLHFAQCLPSPLQPDVAPDSSSTKHTTLLVETFHEHQRLKALLQKLINGFCPLQLLGEDGDWTKDQLWAAIRFLKHTFRFNEILQVLFCFFPSLVISCFINSNKSRICNLDIGFWVLNFEGLPMEFFNFSLFFIIFFFIENLFLVIWCEFL